MIVSTFSYVIPVLLLSIVLNIPKFMEVRFTWTPVEYENGTVVENVTEYTMDFELTELRDNPQYIRYYIMWTQLITTGIIPMGALIYFNFGIFRGIQVLP